MAQLLPVALLNEIRDALLPRVGRIDGRHAMLYSAFVDSPVLHQIDSNGTSATFVSHLIQVLDAFGANEDGIPTLAVLLNYLATQSGGDRAAQLNALAKQVISLQVTRSYVGDHRSALADTPSPVGSRIFIIHGKPDKSKARRLFRRLQDEGLRPWLDEESLVPGQVWEPAIECAIRQCDRVIVLLSSRTATTAGFRQKEIQVALNMADQKPKGSVYIVPARLDEFDMPDRLAHLHFVDLFAPPDEPESIDGDGLYRRGYARLLLGLRCSPMIIDESRTTAKPGAEFSGFEFETDVIDDEDDVFANFKTITEDDIHTTPVGQAIVEDSELFPNISEQRPDLFVKPGNASIRSSAREVDAGQQFPHIEPNTGISPRAEFEPPVVTSRWENPAPYAPTVEIMEPPVKPKATTAPAALWYSVSEAVLEDSVPIVTLAEVRQAWPGFLRQADRISRKTALFLRDAEPTTVEGQTVIVTISNRAYHELLTEKPEPREFICKLLARMLGRDDIAISLELQPAAREKAWRATPNEPQKKRRYDRIAAFYTLE